MDPCPFIRVVVESLALKLPAAAVQTRVVSTGAGVHPTSSSPNNVGCFCVVEYINPPPVILDHQDSSTNCVATAHVPQTVSVPVLLSSSSASNESLPVIFSLHPSDIITRMLSPQLGSRSRSPAGGQLIVSVFLGKNKMIKRKKRKLIGKVRVAVDLETAATRPMLMQSGWVTLTSTAAAHKSNKEKEEARLHIVVRSEPDPRFVLEFGGEPACSPVVYQLHKLYGRQPVFTCRFSADRRTTARSRSMPDCSSSRRSKWTSTFKGWLRNNNEQRDMQQRKGWMVTIHDLSGSPVAAASMTTPFVPSPQGSDRVSRSNPGSWLILRATGTTNNWKPWGRLEAWREHDALGYKFELLHTQNNKMLVVEESSLSVRKGGQFRVSSGVMECRVEGEGKVSKPVLQVAVHHVADLALFVALSAAVDLSMDACQLFSHKLRKQLCQDQQYYTL